MTGDDERRQAFEAEVLAALKRRACEPRPLDGPLRFEVLDVWPEGRYPNTRFCFRLHPHGRPDLVEVVDNAVWERHVGWDPNASDADRAADHAAEIILDVEDSWVPPDLDRS